MTRVRCSVDSCEFWGEDQVCKADVIWVKNNMADDFDEEMDFPDVEFAEDAEVYLDYWDEKKKIAGPSSAETSSQTCCKTMRPRKDRGKEETDPRGGGCLP